MCDNQSQIVPALAAHWREKAAEIRALASDAQVVDLVGTTHEFIAASADILERCAAQLESLPRS